MPQQNDTTTKDFFVEEVIFELDEPQIVLFQAAEEKWFGVLTDEESGLRRWLLAPVADNEYKALLKGRMRVRDAFEKERVLILDLDLSLKQVACWHVDPRSLDQTNDFPDKDVLLTDILEEKHLPEESGVWSVQKDILLSEDTSSIPRVSLCI